jgi:hypothetical protein
MLLHPFRFEMQFKYIGKPQGRAIGSTSMVPAGGSMLDFRLILESPINRGKAFIYNCF